MIAEYMNFFGASFQDILAMPSNWFFKLYNKIPMIEARRAFRQINITSFPHIDDNARENLHGRLMIESGYEKMKSDNDRANQYEDAWAKLRGFGRKV
mgnify:FL=1